MCDGGAGLRARKPRNAGKDAANAREKFGGAKIRWNIVRLRHDAARHRVDRAGRNRLLSVSRKSGYRFCDKDRLKINIAARGVRADSLGTDLVEVV